VRRRQAECDGQHRPKHSGVGADRDHEHRAEEDPDRGPGDCAEDRTACAQRVGSKHRDRSEHDPETMLDARSLGDVDAEPEPDRAARTVLEADRGHAPVFASASLGRLQRCGSQGAPRGSPHARA